MTSDKIIATMFAVPGWSVSSKNLKTQTLTPTNPPADTTLPSKESEDGGLNKSKKRKRASGKSKTSDVNSTNLADLWETVIEGKTKPKKNKKEKVAVEGEVKTKSADHSEKRQNIFKGDDLSGSGLDAAPEVGIEEQDKKQKKKTLREKKREKKSGIKQPTDSTTSIAPIKSTPTIPKPVQTLPKPAAQLTPLQASMRQKLISARFRHLNQTLYTTPSAQSLELFQQNPEMFQEYHEGFRRQVEVWPENPVDGYIRQIQTRGEQRGHMRSKAPAKPTDGETVAPLPRSEGTCYVADLGCGDAGLSQGLHKDSKKLKLKIHSYDLQNPSPLVTKADIANLPLEDGSIDIAIFCLALMGTNWIDFVEEAYRILRWKGELWVAEIKSRFGRVGGKRVEHSVGNRSKKPDKKVLKRQEEEGDEMDLAVEVDGQESTRQATDVSAFVEVLRKRGFVLQGGPDLSNKMFVKLCFVKGLTPMKGKCVPIPKGMVEMGMETWKKKPKGKFVDDEQVVVSSEASVLKPCVYKSR
jgi:ribosomal RNA-processing protein 8